MRQIWLTRSVEDKLGYKSKENSTIGQKAAHASSSRESSAIRKQLYSVPSSSRIAVSIPLATTLEDGITFLQGFTTTCCCTLYHTTARLSRWVKSEVRSIYILKVVHSVIISACVYNYTGSPALIPGFNECIFNSRRYAFGEVFHPVVEVDGVSQSRLCIRCTCQPVSCRHAEAGGVAQLTMRPPPTGACNLTIHKHACVYPDWL